jgi:hypothetical protein
MIEILSASKILCHIQRNNLIDDSGAEHKIETLGRSISPRDTLIMQIIERCRDFERDAGCLIKVADS